MNILVTGVAGFIGHAVARRLLTRGGDRLIGVDNLNDYYDPALKEARLNDLAQHGDVHVENIDIADTEAMRDFFDRHAVDAVIHLAAQAGVRHSIENPHAYGQTNLVGQINILEGCRRHNVRHLVFASSSSVYGLNENMPFAPDHTADHPVSLYAATKRAGELMVHSYSHLYGLPATGLRFFTVYGPWGRPDMALFKFTRAILAGELVSVYNEGNMARDFTYIDDIVQGVLDVLDQPPQANPEWDASAPAPDGSSAPYRVFNIGRGEPVPLMDFVRAIERHTGIRAQIRYMPMQPGDVPATWADTASLASVTGYTPGTSIEQGIGAFVDWYRSFYGV
ncbi:NAD-dependent epimerase [Larsenimonas rhizosphaerae]|uniref:NAD-dependent epimerase n=1 Tax=Larsenimonas rhizosphaerae TaxID=2944682 RepID=UPI002033F47E|nr:NAD-dependent epimerase [Larsenimonas rhizosphaerae]MCM2131829.1 NAD-dependent epimerase [Larsenimonas rhizosphaerae]